MLILNFHRDIKYLFRSLFQIFSHLILFSNLLTLLFWFHLYLSLILNNFLIKIWKKKKNLFKKQKECCYPMPPKVTFLVYIFPNVFYNMCTHPYFSMCVYVFSKWDCTFSSVCLFHILIHYHSTLKILKCYST